MSGLQCKRCYEEMSGVMDYTTREICHECGGNSKVSIGHVPRTDWEIQQFINKHPPRKSSG